MRTRARAAVIIGLIWFSPSWAGAWGKTAHRMINANAVLLLPDPLRGVYLKNKKIIEEEANAPDEWKRGDKSEGSRHYIDMDLYEKYPFPSFPMSRSDAERKFGRKVLEESGTLPWRIEEFYGKLVSAFKAKNTEDAMLMSGDLGHYVGDLHQPLHTTANHDGQLSGSRGVHLQFEEKMVDAHEKDFKFDASGSVKPIDDVLGFVFAAIREGYPDVEKILRADLAGRKYARFGSVGYLDILYQNSGDIARRRIQSASMVLASLWYSAWVKAGKPELK